MCVIEKKKRIYIEGSDKETKVDKEKERESARKRESYLYIERKGVIVRERQTDGHIYRERNRDGKRDRHIYI